MLLSQSNISRPDTFAMLVSAAQRMNIKRPGRSAITERLARGRP
jgi:hypothetical protein